MKNQFYLILTNLFFIFNLYSGNDFIAVHLYNNEEQSINLIEYLQKIQSYINKQAKNLNCKIELASKENLHITLKEISDLSNIERDMVISSLIDLENKLTSFNIKESIKYGKIKISGNRIRFILKKDKNLTKLAKKIEKKLIKLKNNKFIRELKERMDFPLDGHITLGSIEIDKNHSIKEIESIFNNFNKIYSFDSDFIIKNFDLLKSNRPAIKRIYTNKYKFKLK